MAGNATYRLGNASILSVCAVEAPIVVTSASIEEQLAATHKWTGLRPGVLTNVAGVRERRWWPDDVTFADAAAMAGAKALAEAGIDPSQVGVLIDTSVCRDRLEPATAVSVHHHLGLPTSCLNFDVTNACLGFLNGIQLAGTLIDAGQVDYALLVDAENVRTMQENTIARLQEPDVTAADVKEHFATLTLGSGAAAMVLGRTDRHPEGHRVIGGASRAATEHHELCVGDLVHMRTNSKRLFEAGIALALETWQDAQADFDWRDADYFVAHQTSLKHIGGLAEAMGADVSRYPLTLQTYGNMGPASVPFTLAHHVDLMQPGMKVVLMGIGSGLNTSYAEIAW